MTESSSPTEVVNFLILVTFRIKVPGSPYFKLVVLHGYTWFGLMNIVYFDKSYMKDIFDDRELIANWSSQ